MAWSTARRENPYINILRDRSGAVLKVLQAREHEFVPADLSEGESDTGLFAFRTSALRQVLDRSVRESLGVGAVTREQNLLPLLPLFEHHAGGIVTVSATDDEAQGINTPAEAERVAAILHARMNA